MAFNIDVIVPALERLFNASFLPKDIYLISRMPSDPQRGDIVPVAVISLVLAFPGHDVPELARQPREPGGGAAL
jgi:lipoprotein-releasing system permease protein